MRRHATRELVLKALFAYEIEKGSPQRHFDYLIGDAEMAGEEAVEEELFRADVDQNFAYCLLEGVVDHLEQLDAWIDAYAVDWDVKRLGGVDRNILRMGAYEMLLAEEKLPPAIAINEAVNLAKTFGSQDSPRFINGILGRLMEIGKETEGE